MTSSIGELSLSGSWRLSGDNVFFQGSRRRGSFSSGGGGEDDEEALKWAALEKLPTYTRRHHAVVRHEGEDGNPMIRQVDVRQMGMKERRDLMDRIVKVAERDNERFLLKLRERIERVGIDLPKIEVRFQNLQIDADVYVGSRALPTLTNFTFNLIEEMLSSIHLLPSRKKQLNILNNLSGIVKPSRMTLLLGPPSSGKSTLLLALTGKLDSQLRVKGEVTYNGHKLSEFVPERTSAYISQHDTHMGEMTVRETLDFAAQCQGVGSRYDMLTELLHREKEAGIKPDPDIDTFMKAASLGGQKTNLVTDYALKILGLDVCADTYVGDAMHRGISGGQKKRVTTGEMLVGPALAFFMDEISTGLDSSTTYQIIKCLQQIARVLDTTMLISLLQPAPETFELFDDIILLSEGRIVYQGPRELVLDFFEYMGFKCPERKGVADFLQEVTSRKDQGQYWMNKEEPYRYIEVREFAERFESFHVGQRVAADLSLPYEKSRSHPAALASSHYGIGKWELLKACFSREWILMKRNSFIYVFKTVQITVVATFAMTVFLRTEMHQDTVNDGIKYLGALFFGLTNVMFNGFAEISMTIFRLPVFYKQRNMLLYPAWTYSLPIWVMRIPLSFLEAGIWVVLTYYTTGFAPAAGRFFRQFMILFFVHQMALGLFRVIGCTGRSMVVANTFGSFALLVVFVLGGFIVSRNDIPKWWIWGYWISPMQYAENAIAVNEFLDPRWSMILANATESIGVTVLKSRGLFARGYWFWIGLAAMIGFGFFFNILSTLALSYLDPIEKPNTSISEEDYKKKQANSLEGSSKPPLAYRGPGSTPLIQVSGVSNLHSQDGGVAPLEGDIREARMNSNKGMVLPFQPLSMSFDQLNYYVAMPPEMKNEGVTEDRLQLLQNVSGCFRPGVLTALMGVSGAGKTTLMDVLAGRKTGGWIEGNISISGYPKQQKTFARIAGYCEQNDIHSPHITVEESLIFSAWLRLSSDVDSKTRKMFVEEVTELVELDNLRGAIVGIPGVSGLSTEQRKRLTIAVELVANPSVIFMDEPTSGLDARAAAIVMRAVRNTVNTGRTVVCTIHQPSIDIFETFDELLLLKRGGQTIYAGPLGTQSCHLIEYFQGIPGVPEIKEGINPAAWMLDVTSISHETRLQVDFADIYQNSDLSRRTKELIKDLSTPAPESKDLSFPTTYAQPRITQTLACLWKQNRSYWRNPLYNVVRIFFTAMTAFIFGSIFWGMGMKRGNQQDIFNLMGSMYAAILFLGALNNATGVQPVTSVERTVYYREKAAGMYSALPYSLGQMFVEMPYVLLQAILYTVIVYPMIGFEWVAAKVLWFLFFSFFTFLYFTYFGMMTVALTPNFETAAILNGAFLVIWNLFAGFLIPQPSIPVWWSWYYWATPLAWTLYGFCGSQLSDITEQMNDGIAVKDFVEQYFGFHYDMLPVAAVMHVVFTVVFALMFAFCIKHLNFQRR